MEGLKINAGNGTRLKSTAKLGFIVVEQQNMFWLMKKLVQIFHSLFYPWVAKLRTQTIGLLFNHGVTQ